MFRCARNKRDHLSSKEREKIFSSNGAAVLEKIIHNFNGDCNPIRSYSTEDLKNVTTPFHTSQDWCGGIFQNRRIVVKKYTWLSYEDRKHNYEDPENDIAIASRMSNHKNVLKLLGCCLETERPILVFEFPENGNLGTRLFEQHEDQLSWDQKLKIVIEIANSVAYLHYGLPNTFVHRDIKPNNFFLDQNLSPKIFGFGLALQIPKGETHIDTNCATGTYGYIDPVTLRTARYTEKSDVYSFGVLLCEVLTEKKIFNLSKMYRNTDNSKSSSNGRTEFVCFLRDKVEEVCKDYLGDERIRVQVIDYTKLFQKCLQENPEDRPNMIEAEKELRRIKTL